jgi:hypothetical protein
MSADGVRSRRGNPTIERTDSSPGDRISVSPTSTA